ncbi:hypothetical protein PROFUN_14590 [Planoprotostelium fungivorum]|uniref:Uncharacterized protein n=1 Tax=Planoprotostelium fungivorum TaxID=1890364 RepID=A0A2P6MZE0_9EUKA|nr:hypothetical protein PROFUN_14590 [Planoprotostelium fungivorum]
MRRKPRLSFQKPNGVTDATNAKAELLHPLYCNQKAVLTLCGLFVFVSAVSIKGCLLQVAQDAKKRKNISEDHPRCVAAVGFFNTTRPRETKAQCAFPASHLTEEGASKQEFNDNTKDIAAMKQSSEKNQKLITDLDAQSSASSDQISELSSKLGNLRRWQQMLSQRYRPCSTDIKNSEKTASDPERVRCEAKQYQEAVESHRTNSGPQTPVVYLQQDDRILKDYTMPT